MGYIILIRNGESRHEYRGIVEGSLDSPLSELGVAQANALGELLSEKVDDLDMGRLHHVFTANQERSFQTGRIIASKQPPPNENAGEDNRLPPPRAQRRLGEGELMEGPPVPKYERYWKGGAVPSPHDQGDSHGDSQDVSHIPYVTPMDDLNAKFLGQVEGRPVRDMASKSEQEDGPQRFVTDAEAEEDLQPIDPNDLTAPLRDARTVAGPADTENEGCAASEKDTQGDAQTLQEGGVGSASVEPATGIQQACEKAGARPAKKDEIGQRNGGSDKDDSSSLSDVPESSYSDEAAANGEHGIDEESDDTGSLSGGLSRYSCGDGPSDKENDAAAENPSGNNVLDDSEKAQDPRQGYELKGESAYPVDFPGAETWESILRRLTHFVNQHLSPHLQSVLYGREHERQITAIVASEEILAAIFMVLLDRFSNEDIFVCLGSNDLSELGGQLPDSANTIKAARWRFLRFDQCHYMHLRLTPLIPPRRSNDGVLMTERGFWEHCCLIFDQANTGVYLLGDRPEEYWDDEDKSSDDEPMDDCEPGPGAVEGSSARGLLRASVDGDLEGAGDRRHDLVIVEDEDEGQFGENAFILENPMLVHGAASEVNPSMGRVPVNDIGAFNAAPAAHAMSADSIDGPVFNISGASLVTKRHFDLETGSAMGREGPRPFAPQYSQQSVLGAELMAALYSERGSTVGLEPIGVEDHIDRVTARTPWVGLGMGGTGSLLGSDYVVDGMAFGRRYDESFRSSQDLAIETIPATSTAAADHQDGQEGIDEEYTENRLSVEPEQDGFDTLELASEADSSSMQSDNVPEDKMDGDYAP